MLDDMDNMTAVVLLKNQFNLKLRVSEFTVTVDVSENYACILQDNVYDFHICIHTVVLWTHIKK
jgi:hypothetical protein